MTYRSESELESAIKKDAADFASHPQLDWGLGGGLVGLLEQLSVSEYPDWKPKAVVRGFDENRDDLIPKSSQIKVPAVVAPINPGREILRAGQASCPPICISLLLIILFLAFPLPWRPDH